MNSCYLLYFFCVKLFKNIFKNSKYLSLFHGFIEAEESKLNKYHH